MLHGEIKVNNNVVAQWSAVRQTTGIDAGFNDYDCTVTYRDQQGYPCEAKWVTRGHHFGNGPISLTARVLQEALLHLKRVERSQEEDTMWLMNRMMNGG